MKINGLHTENLTLSYGDNLIIRELDMQIPKGEITVFIGSNGCGKSTLLRSLARLLKPKTGTVYLHGQNIHRVGSKKVAQQLAILPQNNSTPEGLTVYQLVKQGRYPYQNWIQQWSKQDEEKVSWALTVTEMESFRDKQVDELSGGQKQRAWIAMILAQETDILLLDEPTTYLDITHQIELLDILFHLNQQQHSTIVMVLHDINLACRYADHVIAIRDQTIFAQGAPCEIVTEEMVESVFDLQSKIILDPLYGTPMCIPYSKEKKEIKLSTIKQREV